MSKKKNGCCLFAAIKWIIIVFALLVAIAFFLPSSNDIQPAKSAPTAASPASTAVPTPSPTAAPTAVPSPKIPGIGGSQAYDVIISLEENGVKRPETKTTEDGLFEWLSETVQFGDTFVTYEIHANENHEILDATFNMFGADNGFLSFAATLPYSCAEKEKAVQFVKEHMTGENASITIGDAIFSIYPHEKGGAMLTIQDIDADAFYSELINIKLGL